MTTDIDKIAQHMREAAEAAKAAEALTPAAYRAGLTSEQYELWRATTATAVLAILDDRDRLVADARREYENVCTQQGLLDLASERAERAERAESALAALVREASDIIDAEMKSLAESHSIGGELRLDPDDEGDKAAGDLIAKMDAWLKRANRTALKSAVPTQSFQARVAPWMAACFGPEISADRLERGDRLIEEAIELVQSGGYPKERIGALTNYVYCRPAGQPAQEVGGVMVTLAAYCLAHDLDMHEAAEAELSRIWTKVEQIRAKQAAKPTGSALPVAAADHIAEAGKLVKPIAWLHALYMELGQTDMRLTMDQAHPFGEAGRDYSREYRVTSLPLYDHPSADIARIRAEAAAERERCARVLDTCEAALNQVTPYDMAEGAAQQILAALDAIRLHRAGAIPGGADADPV